MKILSTKIVYTCPIFRVEERQVEIEPGVTQTHWVVVAKPNVAVVALTNDKKIVLNKEFRSLDSKVRIELPSGKASEYEITKAQAAELALEELSEETGYRAQNIKLLDIVYAGSPYRSRQYYQFVAWDLEFIGQQLEPGEQIEPHLVTIPEVEKLIQTNQIDSPREQEAVKKGIEFFRAQGLI